MSEVNKKILQAIKDDLKGENIQEENATAIGLIRASLKGTFRYTMIFMVVFQLIFIGLAIYCFIAMLDASLAADKVDWLCGVVICAMIAMIMRLYFFMELNRLSVLREIKRVELQLVSLTESQTETQ